MKLLLYLTATCLAMGEGSGDSENSDVVTLVAKFCRVCQ